MKTHEIVQITQVSSNVLVTLAVVLDLLIHGRTLTYILTGI